MKGSILALAFLVCAPSLYADDSSAEVRTHVDRARAALAKHDLTQAGREYEEALKLDPRNVELLTAYGATLYGLGMAREATKDLDAALKLDPNQTTAEIFLGLSKSDLGQCGE